MRLIKQVKGDGCGIACLAMIADKSYSEIKGKYPQWEPDGTTKREMLKALRKCKIKAEDPKRIRNKDYKNFDFDAVLHGYCDGELHWVVWDAGRQRTLDPYRDEDGQERPFRCTSYIGVDRARRRPRR